MASFRRRFGTLPVSLNKETQPSPKLSTIFAPPAVSTPAPSTSPRPLAVGHLHPSKSDTTVVTPEPIHSRVEKGTGSLVIRTRGKTTIENTPEQTSKLSAKSNISTILSSNYSSQNHKTSPRPTTVFLFNHSGTLSQSDHEETNENRDKTRIAAYIVDLWESKGENNEIEALKRLRQLTLQERNISQMRHAGVLRICSDYIKKYDVDPQQPLHPLQQYATTLLSVLVKNEENMREATRYKILGKVLEMLRHPNNPHLSESISIISELSKMAGNRVILKKANYLNTIVPMLRTNREGSTLIAILDSLYLNILYEACNLEIACKAGGVENLSMLICHELASVKLRAIKTLGVIATDNPLAQKSIKKEPATIGFLIKNLITDSGDMLEATAFTISKIVENDTDIQFLVHKGYIWTPLDQRLLKSSNVQLKTFGASILRSLVKNNTMIQNEIRKKGEIIPMVIQNLKSSSEEVRQYSLATTLEIIRNNSDNQKEVFEMDIIPILMNFLNESHNSITHYLTLGIIWSLTKKSATRRKSFLDVGLKEKLNVLSKATQSDQVKRGIEWTLTAITPKGTSVFAGVLSSFVDKELFV